MPDTAPRPWQLLLVGAGIGRITHDMRDRPEDVEAIEAEIAALPGIVRMTLFQVTP